MLNILCCAVFAQAGPATQQAEAQQSGTAAVATATASEQHSPDAAGGPLGTPQNSGVDEERDDTTLPATDAAPVDPAQAQMSAGDMHAQVCQGVVGSRHRTAYLLLFSGAHLLPSDYLPHNHCTRT